MTDIAAVLDYLAAHQETHLEQLCAFLRIPSISAQSDHKPHIDQAVAFLTGELSALGLETERIDTAGNPLVFARTPHREGLPTLLIYGHYDVQPVDPLELWTHPPFEPQVAGGVVRARGASDDKGQLYTHIKALEGFIRTGTPLPANIKLIIEGEEECGGEAIYRFTEQHPERLACDALVISDTGFYNAETPAICYALRGICYAEITVEGPGRDLHSGSFGGAVQNPVNALCRILSGLQDEQGRIRIPGFYDQVRPLDDAEREAFAALDYTDADLRGHTGAFEPFGEAGHTSLERIWARPTCDVNGIWGGYAGEGTKTIIPARAGAKVSMRLVADQDPERIADGFTRFVQQLTPPGVTAAVNVLHKARPVITPRDSAIMQAGIAAIEQGFGRKPRLIREGGSIPIVETFQKHLKVPILLLGYGLPDDNIHSPNERFRLAQFYGGIRSNAHLLSGIAQQGMAPD